MTITKIKSYAKLNLALNIVGKNSSLHKIESLVAFADLHDEIFIKKIKSKKHRIIFTGKFSKNINNKNTISKLFYILEKKKLLKKNKFSIRVNKKIPNKAGLGGGSMNAASVLKYLTEKKIIIADKKKMEKISKLVGSDVILGLNFKNSILNSRNEIKSFDNYKKMYVLIVKPNFGCSTKYVYSKVKNFSRPKFNKPKKFFFNINYLKKMKNSLEPIVLEKFSKLRAIKFFLENLSTPVFVRMTGSGSAIVAYFQTKQRCYKAKEMFNRKFKNCWCIASKTI